MRDFVRRVGQRTVDGVEELGYVARLFGESLYFLFGGAGRGHLVRVSAVFAEAMNIGVQAIPIVALLCLAVGIMLAIQGIETLRTFGAESQVIIGVAISVTREFAPLIVGILVAGRSGSQMTARIGSMLHSQEIDALSVIGISPIRYLVAPLLVAMLLVVPALTILGDLVAILGSALFTSIELGMTVSTYVARTLDVLQVEDVQQGLFKSLVFAVIIVMIGTSNGFQVRGGARGVGQSTTRSVVLSISFIVLADMLFTYFLNR